jgi:anti-sigma factor ChrR (cupin superfamily)
VSGSIKIPVHPFQSALAEFARGRITGAQAQAIISAVAGEPLSPSEVTEAQALLATINGSATAKLARVVEIDHVLLLADSRAPGYDTGALIGARLGV